MRQEIHHHYSRLTEWERLAVDIAFGAAMSVLRAEKVPLVGDDRAERAIDTLACAVIESRS